MSRLISQGFLTIRQAADNIAIAMYSGAPDRPIVAQQRGSGFDVADGEAIANAISSIWLAVDNGKVQAFLVGPKRSSALLLPVDMSRGIPLLRSPRGGDFNFLRTGKPYHRQLVEWFGADLSKVSVVFKAAEIAKLARTLLRARRRKTTSPGAGLAGRPSKQSEVQAAIRHVIDHRRWSSKQSVKALTVEVNRHGGLTTSVSEDTVGRVLHALYIDTGDRRFERIRRVPGPEQAQFQPSQFCGK